MRSTLREVALLISAALFSAVLYRHFCATDFAWVRTAPVISYAADTSNVADFSLDEISLTDSASTPLLVSMEHAAQLQREQAAVFIDAREDERFAAGHIAGAVNVSYYTPESWLPALASLQHQTLLITYCDDDCDSARRLAEALIQRGYKKIYVMDHGFDSWRNAGYPVAQ